MSRRSHLLRGNKGSESPHSVIYVDTETDERELGGGLRGHFLRFGWACYERTRQAGEWCASEWYRFEDSGAFWTWVESKCRAETRTYVFAHNWSFDARVLGAFDLLPARGWKLARGIIESPPVILVWRRDRATLEMIDTLNWWRFPLHVIGETLGMAKLVMPAPTASREAWDAYCRRDVEILRAILHRWWSFLRQHDLGGFARTLAGQAFRAYRHRFMPYPIAIDADDRAQSLGRSAYFGGRTECFRLGRLEGPIHALDVNSMYPSCMVGERYPSRLLRRLRSASVAELQHWSTRHCVVARVQLSTLRPAFPVVVGGRLCFPVGTFAASLTTPELVLALEAGEVVRVDEIALYEARPLFRDYVEALYSLRREAFAAGDRVQSWLLKIMLNSLYGKFGQRGMVWEAIGPAVDQSVRVWSEYDMVEDILRDFRQLGGLLQERMKDSESRESFPAIAAHVTAYARRRLWQLITKAGREHVYYCDTDSLYVDTEGRRRLADEIDPDRLGALKEEDVLAWIDLRGCKDYSTPHGAKIKGIRAAAVHVDESTFRQDKWSTLVGGCRLGTLAHPTTETVTKHLRRVYEKGTVDDAGRVSPLVLADPDG